MGLLDVYAAQADTSAPQPLQAVPRTLGERVEATTAATFSPDRYFNIADARKDMWQRSIDELHTATGEAFPNPYSAVTMAEAMDPNFQPGQIVQQRQAKIIEAARMARAQGNDTLFDPEGIDRYIGEEATRRREKAASYEGTGNGIGNFVASVGMSAVEPINVLALALPVTRLPNAAASAVGSTFLRNVGREALFQAGANVTTQAVTEALDYSTRGSVGTPQTPEEIALNVGGAAVFGGLLGGGVRALHLKWLGLPEKVRADAPLEVRDAFRVIEADSIYSGQNRIGVDPLLHERYQGRAMDAVMRGRPVDLADLTRTADTPLTALGTILRSAPGSEPVPDGMVRMYHGGEDATRGGERHVTPQFEYARDFRRAGKDNTVWYVDVPENSPWLVDSVDVSGTNMPRVLGNSIAPAEVMARAKRYDRGIRVEGIGNVIDRVRALPDTEFEAVLREARPDAFKQIDDIARRSAELDTRAAKIDEEVGQIGLADVVDIDTGARLQDIEAQLAKKGLRKAVRADLERERDMITQSIDPQGRVAEELKAVRADFFPEQQRALKDIEDARAALQREAEAARSVITREVDQVRKKIGDLTIGNRFADEAPADILAREFGTTPADLGSAISRADVLRQGRIFREMTGERIGPERLPASVSARNEPAKEITPDQARALDTEARRLLEDKANASREVSIDGKTMKAAEAMEEADRMEKDAAAALGCAMGAL